MDASYVDINSDGEVRLLEEVYYETKDSYTFDVIASDGLLSDTKTVTVNINDVNEAPIFTNAIDDRQYWTFQENSTGNIGIVTAEDADGDNLSFSITGGADQEYFEIETIENDFGLMGRVKIKEYGQPDFDIIKNTHPILTTIPGNPGEHAIMELEISVSDGSSSTKKIFHPAVYNNVFDDPIIDDYDVTIPIDNDLLENAILENSASGTSVGITIFSEDADVERNTVTYSLTDNSNVRFEIDPSTGVVSVKEADLLDYETDQNHTITVEARSLDNSTSSNEFSITVLNDPYDDDFDVTTPIDNDPSFNAILESFEFGSYVGITVFWRQRFI